MRYVAFDTETHLIKPGMAAPRLVCVSTCDKDGARLLDRQSGLAFLRGSLADDDLTLVGHNVAYDLGVIAAEDPELVTPVFAKYAAGQVQDTMVRQQLADIARGSLKVTIDPETGEVSRTRYHLADLTARLLGRELAKADTFRLKYALLDGVPVDRWPEEARTYALEDARATFEVFMEQERRFGPGPIPNSAEQHKAAWVLHLVTLWGIRTDAAATTKLKQDLEAEHEEAMARLRQTDVIHPRTETAVAARDRKNLKAIRARVERGFASQSRRVPTTPKLQISVRAETLKASGDVDLGVLAGVAECEKLLTAFVPVLERGTRVPINARYNVLVESGRTSCSSPNIQQLPRKGGVRECFIARPGSVFCFVDYDTLELRSLAQVCLDLIGYSRMAEALRRGEDLHLRLGAELLGLDFETAQARLQEGDKEVKEARQMAKVANFGFPGGMSAPTFVEYARGYGFEIPAEKAQLLRQRFMTTWTEMRDYFEYISGIVGDSGEGTVVQLRSGRVRGRVRYCAAANSFFQGLAADGAKDALWSVTQEAFTAPSSPLWGIRPVAFIHDEIVSEIPYDPRRPELASRAAKRKAEVMIEAMRRWIPDVPITCKPVLTRRWYKGAEPVIGQDGELVPCRPMDVEERGRKRLLWVPDIAAPRAAA